MGTSRAQSEVVGTLLLIGVVTIAISLFGVLLLDSITQSTEGPQSNFNGALTDDGLEIVHRGGDSLQEDDLEVRITNGSTTLIHPFADGEVTGGEPNGKFERSEQWRLTTVPVGPEIEVWFYHTPTGTILYQDTLYRV